MKTVDGIAYKLGALISFILKWALIAFVVVVVGKWAWSLF